MPRTLLLVSDNGGPSTRCSSRQTATTTVVAVKYDSMSLADLGDAISKSAPAGAADAVGILDHGAPGRFCLLKSVGGGDIDLADLATDASIAAFFKWIGGESSPGGRIDLLGCSVAAGPEGRALLAQVEALAGVNVTASTDKIGGAADADWEMETRRHPSRRTSLDVEALKQELGDRRGPTWPTVRRRHILRPFLPGPQEHESKPTAATSAVGRC